MIKPDNPHAFPTEDGRWNHHGMSLRDLFAGQALAGMSASSFWDYSDWDDVAAAAYNAADAMLAERDKEKRDE